MKHRNRKQAVASARKQRRAANRRANRTNERIDGRVTGKTSNTARNRRQRRAIEAQAETYAHPHNVRIDDEITARLVRAETKRQKPAIIAAPIAEPFLVAIGGLELPILPPRPAFETVAQALARMSEGADLDISKRTPRRADGKQMIILGGSNV